MAVTQNIPQLRFPGFEGEWEQKKLGDLGKIRMCKRVFSYETSESGEIPFYKIGTFGKEADAYITNELYFNYRERFSFPKIGEILMSASGTLGRTVVYDGKPAYFQDSNIVWIDNNEKLITNSFLYYIYQIVKYDSEGGTIQRLYNSIISNTKFNRPTLPEQQKIASFLSAIDEKIQQLSRKKELLSQYKKGVMQQLFSGKLRFKDEDGRDYADWEEKKLGDVANIKRGASPRPITSSKWFSDSSKIGWVRISDVTKSNKYLEKTVQYLSAEGISKSRLVKKGSIIMSICATIGKPIYTNFEVCIHDGFVVFEKLQADREFLFYYLDKIQLGWYRYGQPGSQVNLNIEIVSNETMPYPSIAEQQKIANFLSSIDVKIESTSKQINQTQSFKKGLLQQMFV